MKKILYIAAIAAAFACTPTDKQQGEYADFERVPLQSEIQNVQPMTGIVLWNTNGRSITAK
ncbi:MAG: DUF4832 domain-containing protein, partial [Bacteroidales bacterium]|nr:DUF4832 domain-containing protein [Bacteroidales bacterium]